MQTLKIVIICLAVNVVYDAYPSVKEAAVNVFTRFIDVDALDIISNSVQEPTVPHEGP